MQASRVKMLQSAKVFASRLLAQKLAHALQAFVTSITRALERVWLTLMTDVLRTQCAQIELPPNYSVKWTAAVVLR